jgi:SAM-dependent methyltransferase
MVHRAAPNDPRMTDPTDALFAEARHESQLPAFREAVWRHDRHRLATARLDAFSTVIHPDDQMLRHSLRHFRKVNDALTQYFAVALQQHDARQQILSAVFGERAASASILDFACGFGRSLRFLVQSHARSRVWASEIQHEAVDFVAAEFGVNGIRSTFDPAAFDPGRTFDFIWVASLFSHLPAALFQAWLDRLSKLLTPQGVLCFSVHDECLLPAHHAMPDQGIHFVPDSEIEELDNRAYGTSHVREAFVASALRAALDTDSPRYVRLRRALAHEQDVYVVALDSARDLTPLAGFRRGTWGWVDRCEIVGRTLELSGWAASLDDGPVALVDVVVDGETFACTTGVRRDDVAAVLGDGRLGPSGWERTIPLARGEPFLEVSAASAAGERALLYAGSLRVPDPKR